MQDQAKPELDVATCTAMLLADAHGGGRNTEGVAALTSKHFCVDDGLLTGAVCVDLGGWIGGSRREWFWCCLCLDEVHDHKTLAFRLGAGRGVGAGGGLIVGGVVEGVVERQGHLEISRVNVHFSKLSKNVIRCSGYAFTKRSHFSMR